MHPGSKDRRVRIAFFCGPDRKFLPDIVDHFSKRTEEYEVQVFHSKSVKDFTDTLAWSDISWFEWCDNLIVEASKLPKVCRLVCRLHRYEAFTRMPAQVDWSKVDILILVAHHIKDALKMQIPDMDERVNVQVIYNGVNLKRFVYRERKKGYNIAYIGYLNYRKNPSLLLQCIRYLVDRDPRYVLHIAGRYQDMESKLYIDQMVGNLDLRDNIVFHGWIDDLNSWLEDKHFLLSTSIHEGCPCGIMEAMASGLKPLIHNFFAAEELYPRKYIFNTLDEFANMVTSDDYSPAEYRKYIENNYSLERQLGEIESAFTHLWAMDAGTCPLSRRPGAILRCNALESFLKDMLEPGQKVLDVGGFDGLLASRLKTDIAIDPVVLDTDFEGLEIARSRGLETCLADALQMPYGDASFDVVLCLDVLEHVQDDAGLLNEISRVLKPDGMLVLTAPVEGAPFASVSGDELERLHKRWEHLKPGYQLDAIRSLLGEAGFALEQITGYYNAESQQAYADLFIRPNIIPYEKRLILWDRITKSESPSDEGNFEHLIIARKR